MAFDGLLMQHHKTKATAAMIPPKAFEHSSPGTGAAPGQSADNDNATRPLSSDESDRALRQFKVDGGAGFDRATATIPGPGLSPTDEPTVLLHRAPLRADTVPASGVTNSLPGNNAAMGDLETRHPSRYRDAGNEGRPGGRGSRDHCGD